MIDRGGRRIRYCKSPFASLGRGGSDKRQCPANAIAREGEFSRDASLRTLTEVDFPRRVAEPEWFFAHDTDTVQARNPGVDALRAALKDVKDI